MLTMHSMMSGMGHRMLEGLLGTNLGHIQIHRVGYRERGGATRTLNNADLVLTATRETAGVEGATGRIYGFAHASIVRGDDQSIRDGGGEEVATPVLAIVGLEAEHEGQVTDIPTKLVEGRWFQGTAEVVIGAGLAKRHHLELGDAVLPTAVDMTGAMRGPWAVSDEVPRVVGVLRTGVERFDSWVASRTAATALGVAVGDRIAVEVPIDCGEGIAEADCLPSEEPFLVAGIVDEPDLLGGRFALVSDQVLTGNIAALAPGIVSALGEADQSAVTELTSGLHGEVAAPDEVLPWTELAPELAQ